MIDMEAVVLDSAGKSGFQALQAALGERGNRSQIVAYAFDLLHLDGRDLTRLPLVERKELLRSILERSSQDALRYSDHIAGRGADMFETSCSKGLEGIISKRADAPYMRAVKKTG